MVDCLKCGSPMVRKYYRNGIRNRNSFERKTVRLPTYYCKTCGYTIRERTLKSRGLLK